MKLTAIILILIFTTSAQAGEFSGRVVGISDGDTLTVLDSNRVKHRVRLAEIDAPEKRQPFGQRSKQALSDQCFGRIAVIEDQGRDQYGRTIGRVICDGTDANAEQIKRGMAWVYDRYVNDQHLYALQKDARADRRGLWADSTPTPPWEWRRRSRKR